MTVGIYKITNNKNGKCYIGQSVNVKKRWGDHIRREDSIISKAIDKYGVENFSFDILEECKKEELDKKEIYYINKFKSLVSQNGYNVSLGGASRIDEETYKRQDMIIEKIKNGIDFKEIAETMNVSLSLVYYINRGEIGFRSNISYPITDKTVKANKRKCSKCKAELHSSTKGTLCIDCLIKDRSNKRPTKEELEKKIKEDKNFSKVGRYYEVSATTIKRWCLKYNISNKIVDYK